MVFLLIRFPFFLGKCGSKAKNIYFAFLENEVEEILFHWLYNRAGRMPSDRKPLSPSFDQNRTSQYHWTQCPNISGCQRSFFSPFSEQNVPLFQSFRVEHSVPILLLAMGLISLSDLWTHITLKSVWSSLNLVWHMSCRKSIVPVKFTVWTFINLNLVVIYIYTYLMCTWVVIEHIQYLDGILTTYIDYIVCAFELWMTCIQVESDCSSCRRSGSAN